jgi:hypothetical protein
MLTRESFFALKPEVREVQVPALGGSVFVRMMTAGDRDRFEADQIKSGEKDFRARLTAATACDADGVLLFGPGDVAALTKLPSVALDDIARAAIDLNRFSHEDVEELEGN